MSKKCFNIHVAKCVSLTSNGLEIFNKHVEFVWVQGVVTNLHAPSCKFTVDDGTTSLMVIALPEHFENLQVGKYVLVQGSIAMGEDEASGNNIVALEARIVSGIADPNMETLWFLEVMESISL